MSLDEENRGLYEAREMFLHNQATRMDEAKEEGLEEGMKKLLQKICPILRIPSSIRIHLLPKSIISDLCYPISELFPLYPNPIYQLNFSTQTVLKTILYC